MEQNEQILRAKMEALEFTLEEQEMTLHLLERGLISFSHLSPNSGQEYLQKSHFVQILTKNPARSNDLDY